ncbi:helix-turn-helix domain-containing protein [Streptomyces sp. NPDC054945]
MPTSIRAACPATGPTKATGPAAGVAAAHSSTATAALAGRARSIRTPSDPRTATERVGNLCTSSTSLRRAFRAETGTAFSEWRTRLRPNHSLSLLEQGQLVSSGAARVGLVSTDGYILAFRRHFGRTPGAYVRNPLDRSA